LTPREIDKHTIALLRINGDVWMSFKDIEKGVAMRYWQEARVKKSWKRFFTPNGTLWNILIHAPSSHLLAKALDRLEGFGAVESRPTPPKEGGINARSRCHNRDYRRRVHYR
jgi:hypothetical protein